MRAYLDALDEDPFVSPDGAGVARPPVPRVIAALRPPMLRLAAEKALGAHTFLVPVEHTRRARELLGPDALLVVEQKVVLADDASLGRSRARAALAWYLDTPNYLDNLRWLGFADGDFEDGGSDALVDALVAVGDEERDPRARAGAPRRGRDAGRDPPARGGRPVRPRDAAAACPVADGLSSQRTPRGRRGPTETGLLDLVPVSVCPRRRRGTGQAPAAAMFFSTTSIVCCSSPLGLNSTTCEPAWSIGVWPGGA